MTEKSNMERQQARRAVGVLLQWVGEDPAREGLLDTPKRVVKALSEMTAGYAQDPKEILSTTFERCGYDEMVVLRGVPFNSLCEHHMLGFSGTVTLGYVPGDRVVGLSKLARLVECYALRLQIQERMTSQLLASLTEHLEPLGAAVRVTAKHSCMSCRGVRKSASMVTSALSGVIRTDPSARAEFFQLAGE